MLTRFEDEDTRGLFSLLDPPARLRIQIAKISPALESKVTERIQVPLEREGSYPVDAHVLLAVSLDEILHERVRGLEDTAGREEPDSVYQRVHRRDRVNVIQILR